MKKALFIAIFLPFFAFAADSVDISGVSVNIGSQTATINGTSVYDTSSKTDVSVNGNEVGSTPSTSWSFTKRVGAGSKTASAVNGNASDSFSFVMPSNEGGLTGCQIEGTCPTFGLSAPSIPNQTQKLGAVKPTIPLKNFWAELQKYLVK